MDVRHPAREAAEKAEAGARGQVKDQIAALYQMSPETLGAEVERKCSRCKANMPWLRTRAAKRSRRIEAAGTMLLSGTVLIVISWLAVSLAVVFFCLFSMVSCDCRGGGCLVPGICGEGRGKGAGGREAAGTACRTSKGDSGRMLSQADSSHGTSSGRSADIKGRHEKHTGERKG